MSAPPLNREELLRDSQATLRKVAGVLDELWDLQPFETNGSGCHDAARSFSGPGADVARILANTHREVQALQEGIGALHDLLPVAITQGESRKPSGSGLGTVRWRRSIRASEILTEVQSGLDRIAHDIGPQGLGME